MLARKILTAVRSKALKIICGIVLYVLFAFALNLGLQVKPLYGNIALGLVIPLIILYFVWILRRPKP